MPAKRSQTRTSRQAKLLEAAAQVGHAITSLLDLDALFSQVVDIICDTYGFYYAGVFLIDPHQPSFAVLRAGRGEIGRKMVEQGHKLAIADTSMIGWCINHRQARIAPQAGQDAIRFRSLMLPETRSEMALPLAVGDQVIGALTIQSAVESAFGEMDITSLQAMADQLAIAIQNAYLHAQAQRRARLLEAAAQVGRNVTSILSLDELLPKTVDIICDTYDLYYAAIFLEDETGQWAMLRAGYGEAGRIMLEREHKLEVADKSMVGWCVRHRQARIALDVGQEAVRFDNPLLPKTRSEMALPLLVGDQVIGAVSIQSEQKAAFSPEDINSLQAMADQLAVAINNAHLLAELEAAHRELVRTKTFEAIASATGEAIHWIGNKAMPILNTVKRMRDDLARLALPASDSESLNEDLELIDESARLIMTVKEALIGPTREHKPRPAMLQDVARDATVALGIAPEMITYQVAEGVPLARVDTTQMHRVFTNLLKNALEAMEGRAEQHITIGVRPADEPGLVEVTITDTGCGIPAADMDKMWVTFYTTKNSKVHPGLGLAACLQVVEQMDGKISAHSEVGVGTTFTILLPEATEKNSGSLPKGNQTLLLVDDDDDWRRFARVAFEQAGYRVNTTTDLAGIDPTQFERIVVDQILQRINALDAMNILRQSNTQDRAVVVTSRLVIEQTTDLLQAGARDVLLKPYTAAELATLL
jgi:signal transduction histidine kinase